MDTPVLVETSYSLQEGPAAHGVDTDTQWWCEVTRRPRTGDAIASVTPPGSGEYSELVTVTLPADDLDDTETAGRYAVNLARALVQAVNDSDDDAAIEELKGLLSSAGPMGDYSGPAWSRVLEWLKAARSGDLQELVLHGNGWPQNWTIAEVADYLGYAGVSATGSARRQLSRWGIQAVSRQPGRDGQNLYAVDQVRAAHTQRPGQGARSDLRK
ncbi:hypothetical protein ACIQNU_04605 [Streptomyces sp. NPDC091292]|uniref:hypothetical protein n=1 Tax=Streptomyces sp. NPDC091292 TaxID=3365991 RepID=UPI0037F273B9